jgi:hypothetical protein
LTGQEFSPTHVLRSGQGVRFDHLWVSDEVAVRSLSHLPTEAKSCGSDHALVVADMVLNRRLPN